MAEKPLDFFLVDETPEFGAGASSSVAFTLASFGGAVNPRHSPMAEEKSKYWKYTTFVGRRGTTRVCFISPGGVPPRHRFAPSHSCEIPVAQQYAQKSPETSSTNSCN